MDANKWINTEEEEDEFDGDAAVSRVPTLFVLSQLSEQVPNELLH